MLLERDLGSGLYSTSMLEARDLEGGLYSTSMLDSTGFFIVLVTSFFTSFSCFLGSGSGSLKVKISGAGLEEASGSMRKVLLHAVQSMLEPIDRS